MPLQGAQLRRRVHAGGALGEREGIELVYSVDGATHTLKAFALDDGRAGDSEEDDEGLDADEPDTAESAPAAADAAAAEEENEPDRATTATRNLPRAMVHPAHARPRVSRGAPGYSTVGR